MSKVFSYSRINTFKNCRELYHINYIQGIRKENENIEAYLGSCVHHVIEDIYENNNQIINFDEIIYMYDKTSNRYPHKMPLNGLKYRYPLCGAEQQNLCSHRKFLEAPSSGHAHLWHAPVCT